MAKICVISPSLQMGGIERQLSLLSDYFVSKGHEVYFLACRAGKHFFNLNDKVTFREPNFIHSGKTISKFWNYHKTIKFLRRNLKEIKPDTILVFGDIINPIAIIANRGLSFPIYIADQISPKQNLGRFKNVMKQITYKQATGIIAQSKMAADYKHEVFGNDINLRIIPNSIREVASYPNLEKQPWIIGVGRLSFEKGFDRLIEVFSKIKNHEEWRLVLAGDGPMRKQLESLTLELGIADRVDFLGARNDVDELLAKSSIFVIPSRYEGFPNALCEAMASPLPCIAFDSIAAEDLINNQENGVIVQDGNIEDMAHKLEDLMDNPQLRIKYANNAYFVRQRLNKEKIGDAFLDFILSYN